MAEPLAYNLGNKLDQIAMYANSVEEAIAQAMEAGRNTPLNERGGITYADGTFVPYTDKQMVETALSNLAGAAAQRARGSFVAQQLKGILGGDGAYDPGVQQALVNRLSAKQIAADKSLWQFKPEDIGKIIDDPERGRILITDPNKTQLTPQELAEYKKQNEGGSFTLVNAATGYQMGTDPVLGRVFSTVDEAPRSARYTTDAYGNTVPFEETYADPSKSWSDFSKFGKSIVSKTTLPDGSTSVTYSDGTRNTFPAGTPANVISQTGSMINPYAPGTAAAENWNERKSAYDMLYSEFAKYGLQSLVTPLQGLIQSGVSPSEFTIQLRNTDAYRQRFGANQARIQKGLRALSEAEYIGLEDQYQDVMRRYGLPQSYYQRGDMGRQEGFEKFISSDVSPVELEDRVQTAYNRVINANPEVGIALRNFYPSITNGDILAYALNPDKALNEIQRKITAAEIGGAAVQSGLTTNESDADYLARYGITKEQAQQGYRTISGYLPRAQQLSSIYGKQVEGGPYTQASAEREVFNVPGAAEEERKRQKITSLEQAAFSGQSGLTQGALGRERAGQF